MQRVVVEPAARPRTVGPNVERLGRRLGIATGGPGTQFYPASLTIDAGDTVQWSFPTAEYPHRHLPRHRTSDAAAADDPSASAPAGGTTYDGSVYTSSGFMAGGAKYALTFTKPGTYRYWCTVHVPEMVGTIVVQSAGSPYPNSQSAYDAQAQTAENADLSAGTASVSLFPYAAGGRRRRGDRARRRRRAVREVDGVAFPRYDDDVG